MPAGVFAALLVFVRTGAAVMLLPGFGEPYVAPQVRLLIALLIALLLAPVLAGQLPPAPDTAVELSLLILGEAVIGLFMGTFARLFLTTLTNAGMVIAFSSSLANALVNDPSAAQQGSIAGSFLTAVALVMIFTLDLHHLMLLALVDSYSLFVPGQAPPLGDFSDMVALTVTKTFLLSIQIAAPFMALGIIFYLGVGLLSRLMPQVQVFFIVMPLQILLAIGALFLALPLVITWFLGGFEESLEGFLVP